jgi:hypothetical protein
VIRKIPAPILITPPGTPYAWTTGTRRHAR